MTSTEIKSKQNTSDVSIEEIFQFLKNESKHASYNNKPQRAYQLWYYEGPIYFGANLNVVALAKCPAEAVLKLHNYIYQNTKNSENMPISLISRELNRIPDKEHMTDLEDKIFYIAEMIIDELFLPNDTMYIIECPLI